RIYNLDTGAELARWQPHGTEIHSLAFSPDGTKLATGGADFVVKIWDVASKKELHSLAVREDKDKTAYFPTVHCLTFSPDGHSLFGGSNESNMWNAATGAVLWKKRTHTWGTFSAPFSPDGETLATAGSAGDGNHVLVFNPATGSQVRILKGPQDGWKGAEDVAFDPKGRFLASAGPDNRIRLWDVKTWTELQPPQPAPASKLPLEKGAGGADVASVKVRDFTGHKAQVHSVAFSGDGKRAITGSPDKTACVWDVETGERLAQFLGHTDDVTAVALSPDGKLALTGGADRSIHLWEVSTAARWTAPPACSSARYAVSPFRGTASALPRPVTTVSLAFGACGRTRKNSTGFAR